MDHPSRWVKDIIYRKICKATKEDDLKRQNLERPHHIREELRSSHSIHVVAFVRILACAYSLVHHSPDVLFKRYFEDHSDKSEAVTVFEGS